MREERVVGGEGGGGHGSGGREEGRGGGREGVEMGCDGSGERSFVEGIEVGVGRKGIWILCCGLESEKREKML